MPVHMFIHVSIHMPSHISIPVPVHMPAPFQTHVCTHLYTHVCTHKASLLEKDEFILTSNKRASEQLQQLTHEIERLRSAVDLPRTPGAMDPVRRQVTQKTS